MARLPAEKARYPLTPLLRFTSWDTELDQWTERTVLNPLYSVWHDAQNAPEEVLEEIQQEQARVEAAVKKAIREKVLESYRNGSSAGPRESTRRQFPARKQT